MTDRELLELAAKAAGVGGSYFHSDNPIHCGIYQARGEYYWNPLVSDSEALRLAVKLAINVQFEATLDESEEGWHPTVHCGTYGLDGPEWSEEPLGIDETAATRRAIVRCAAEVGRSMA